jgi:predicted enzyme related to lactoylglutathione lyase
MRISAVWYAVSQWEEAKRFYCEVLGLKLNHWSDEAGWAAFSTDGGPPFFLVRRPDLVGGQGNATVTFETADLDAFHERLARAGVPVEPIQESNARIFTLYDPDGNRLEVSEALRQGSAVKQPSALAPLVMSGDAQARC